MPRSVHKLKEAKKGSRSKLNVLMLSLGSHVLTNPMGDVCERHKKYAELLGSLHMIVYTPKRLGLKPVKLSRNFFVYPSNSISRYSFPLDILLIAYRIIQRNKIELITTQDPFSTGLIGVLLKYISQKRKKLVVNNHSEFFSNSYWLQESWLNSPLRKIGKFVIKRANGLRVINSSERKAYADLGIPKDRIAILPTPVDTKKFAKNPSKPKIEKLRKELGIPSNFKIVLWVGRPVLAKRVEVLLAAARIALRYYPAAKFILVGGLTHGSSSLMSMVEELNLKDDVILAGLVAHNVLPTYYHMADVYVQTSWYEGFGKVFLEAGVTGTPIIATQTAGARDIFEKDQSAVLCELENPSEIAKAILMVLEDPIFGKNIAERAKMNINRKFSRQKSTKAIIKFWQKVLLQSG